VTASIIQGNARHLPLADNTVDLVVTSPPYFALRSYQDGGEHYDGQIGSEPTPAEFVAALLDVTRECVRVLKPSGSLWVNLGDKYAGSGMGGNTSLANSDSYLTKRAEAYHPCLTNAAEDGSTDQGPNATMSVAVGRASSSAKKNLGTIRSKSLIGIPWRYALACIDDLGLILRAEVIWSKPNGLPESVTDRVRRSHEQWFHFTLEPRYYSAVDEIREAHDQRTIDDRKGARRLITGAGAAVDRTGDEPRVAIPLNPLGKLPGSVWTIPTEPLTVPAELGVDHFAAFPTEWPRRIIQGWSPAGVCVECGEGRRPVVHRVTTGENNNHHTGGRMVAGSRINGAVRSGSEFWKMKAEGGGDRITGYACACPEPTAPTTPGVVLDPFGGTGTTALVADVLGRHGISVDMSADYCRLARWRTTDPGQRAKAARVEKPRVEAVGQMDLFEMETPA
jgi:DNA modification methylase